MKTSYGANDEELLLPVDAEADQYGHEESSLMRSPELNGNGRSTRFVKFFTLVVVVAALLGSTMYLSSSIRGNVSRRLSIDYSNSDATKPVNVGPNTTIKDIIDQLLWGPSPPKYQYPQPTMSPNIRSNPLPTCPQTHTENPSYIGTKTVNSTVIFFNQIYDHLNHYLFLQNEYFSFCCSASRILCNPVLIIIVILISLIVNFSLNSFPHSFNHFLISNYLR
jgi:hypothetical protein